MYIDHNDLKTIRKISAGSYLLRFALGTDWDAMRQKFLRDREFFQAGEKFDFTETETSRSIEYTEIEVSLHLVPNGNLQRESIDEATFDEGDSN